MTGEGTPQRWESLFSLPSLLTRYGSNELREMDYEEAVRETIELIGNGNYSDSTLGMIEEIIDKMAQTVADILTKDKNIDDILERTEEDLIALKAKYE